jgi:hypothetical protein
VPEGDAVLPQPTLLAAMISGNVATGDSVLSSASLAASASQIVPGTGVGAIAPAFFTLDAAALTGSLSDGAVQPLPFTLAATAANHAPAEGDIQLAVFTVLAQANQSGIGAASITLDAAYLSAGGVAGEVSTASLEVPLFSVSATDGNLDIIGTATIGLPAFSLSALARGVALASTSLVGVNLNTRTRAVSNYEGVAPNSLARFGGVTLMATADGIVALTGDTDVGNPISASLTVGKSNLGGKGVQRVLTGYVGYRASGDLELTLITDDHHENVYVLVPRRLDEQHTSRVKFGHGVKGTYWQFKLANVDGSDFCLDKVELHPAATGGRA